MPRFLIYRCCEHCRLGTGRCTDGVTDKHLSPCTEPGCAPGTKEVR